MNYELYLFFLQNRVWVFVFCHLSPVKRLVTCHVTVTTLDALPFTMMALY